VGATFFAIVISSVLLVLEKVLAWLLPFEGIRRVRLNATGKALARRWVVEKMFIFARLSVMYSLFQGKIN